MKFCLNTDKIEQKVSACRLSRALFSQTCLAFVYGIYLCMYEISFLDDWIAPFHVLLIGWTAVITMYNVAVRKIWEKLPAWKWLFLFFVSAGITTVLNRETGLVSNVKSWVLSVLPICAFLPVCLGKEPKERQKIFFSVLLGAAAVVFVASAVSIVTYLIRFDKTITILGVTEQVGIHWLDEGGSLSVLLYGVYLDPNYAAAASVFFAIYSAALFLECRRGMFAKRWKNVLGQCFGIANLVVQLCYFPLANSRGAWLSLIVAGLTAIFLYLYCVAFSHVSGNRKTFLALAVSVACVLVLCAGAVGTRTALSYASYRNDAVATGAAENANSGDQHADSFAKQDDGTGSGRLVIWKEALTLFTHKPLFGTAPRNNQYYMLKYGLESEKLAKGIGVHNSYLDVLLEYGAVGAVLLFGFFVICMIGVLKRVFGKAEKDSSYYLVIWGALVICCTSAFLSASFINTTAMYYLMLVSISCLIAADEKGRKGAVK